MSDVLYGLVKSSEFGQYRIILNNITESIKNGNRKKYQSE